MPASIRPTAVVGSVLGPLEGNATRMGNFSAHPMSTVPPMSTADNAEPREQRDCARMGRRSFKRTTLDLYAGGDTLGEQGEVRHTPYAVAHMPPDT